MKIIIKDNPVCKNCNSERVKAYKVHSEGVWWSRCLDCKGYFTDSGRVDLWTQESEDHTNGYMADVAKWRKDFALEIKFVDSTSPDGFLCMTQECSDAASAAHKAINTKWGIT